MTAGGRRRATLVDRAGERHRCTRDPEALEYTAPRVWSTLEQNDWSLGFSVPIALLQYGMILGNRVSPSIMKANYFTALDL